MNTIGEAGDHSCRHPLPGGRTGRQGGGAPRKGRNGNLWRKFKERFFAPSPPLRIYLDDDEAKRERAGKIYRHHVVLIPSLRAFGLVLIALFVLLHNLYLLPTPAPWSDFWNLLAIYALYTAVSWLILWLGYNRSKTTNLGLFFLLFDIVLFLTAVYYSGGEKSWLFFLLMVRTADQARSTWRHTLLFANASALGYVLLLLYLGYVEQRALSFPAEMTKISFIYASNIYLSFVSRAADRLRNRMNAAVRLSRDLIRQLEAQSNTLKASEKDYRALVEGSIQGVYIHENRIIQLANPALARIFGYESPDLLVGIDYATLVAPHEYERLEGCRTALLQGWPTPERYEYQGLRRDGTLVWIECQVSHITWRDAPAFLATLQDITSRRQAEETLQNLNARLESRVQQRTAELLRANESLRTEIIERQRAEEERHALVTQLQQAQKSEAIGTLAGGIAHDFNNILGAIMGYSELAQRVAPPNCNSNLYLNEVLKASIRAKDLVAQILTFSRRGQAIEKRPFDIRPIIKEALKLLRATLPTTIELRQQFVGEPCFVLADPTQIHQIMVNLCTNAAHAMREGGGVLEVTQADVELDAEAVTQYRNLGPGSFVELTIKDTGHGMDAATLERIFDPYFTTKKVGEGSGLGLAVVHGIVQTHQGSITVTSAPNEGTTFRILFPRIKAIEEETQRGLVPVQQGSERILFVDDESTLVALAKEMLGSLGYDVTVKVGSNEALGLFRECPDAFDLIITDYTMPQLTGTDLAREMLRIRPGIPIILCTGFSREINEQMAREAGIAEFAIKPLSMSNLSEAIRKALKNGGNHRPAAQNTGQPSISVPVLHDP